MPATRVLLPHPPPADPAYRHETSPWPTKWICLPDLPTDVPTVTAYRLPFTLDKPSQFRIHVTADNRYDLFLNGDPIGRGPERGDRHNWFFESYDLTLPAGPHTLVARTFYLADLAPYAQCQVRPGFFLHADGDAANLLSTGVAPWTAKRLPGHTLTPSSFPGAFSCVGARTTIDGAAYPWAFETGAGDDWQPAIPISNAAPAWLNNEWPDAWHLRPATLPALKSTIRHIGTARHVDTLPDPAAPVDPKLHIEPEAKLWTALLTNQPSATVTIPPNSTRRVIVDFDDYVTAYPRLVTTGGRGAKITINWAEALYIPNGHEWEKRNRNDIAGKIFRGWGDTFLPDGGPNRPFEPLWWEAGRYAQFLITTKDDPLTLTAFHLRDLHYPHAFESTFTASDPRLEQLTPLALRTLETCSHDTYFDCPYYEQLMYVGDTRLEVLVTYATTRDDRLPKKALDTFNLSRTVAGPAPGLTHARYPSRVHQYIPPFSLWFVAMAHDFALWRDDKPFLATLMPGVRTVLDAYRQHLRPDGLLDPLPGWNFCDWVPAWPSGVPPTGSTAPIATLNFQAAYVLRRAAELEDLFNEPDLAARNRKTAAAIAAAAHNAFWDDKRNLYAETIEHNHFSQHAQCLALLGNSVPEPLRDTVAANLFAATDLAPTTIYFTHYLFETARMTNRIDAFFRGLDFWHNLHALGFKTTVEMPEPSRSDCHAWGAHPVYHYYASVLGIRPNSFGFETAEIRPQLGPLTRAAGTLVHPKGAITVDFTQQNGKLSGSITLPEGVTATLTANGKSTELPCGPTRF